MLRVLLVGGTGVLSSDTANIAEKNGHQVYILNRGSKKSEYVPESNVIIADIRNYDNTSYAVKDMYFDVVIDFISFNVSQLQNTMRIFSGKCKQYIFISSATVYSRKSTDRITEDSEINNDLWEYAKNKYLCEDYLRTHASECEFEFTIIRPYITYGKTRIPYPVNSRINQGTLLKRIEKGKPIVVWNDGNAVCTLTNTIDFATALVSLFLNNKAYGEPFHITSGFEYSWNEVIGEIYKQMHQSTNLVYINAMKIEQHFNELQNELTGDKATTFLFDNSKIIHACDNFSFKIPLPEGLKQTIAYYIDVNRSKPYDYEWDARLDALICQQTHGEQKKQCHYIYYSSGHALSNYMEYHLCRNNFTYPIFRFFKKYIRVIKNKVKIAVRIKGTQKKG